jgi:hypothetical protein
MKKPIFKRWWFWVVVVIVVIGIAANVGGNDNPQTASGSDTPANATPKEEPKNKPTISKAEFDQIQNGMTYDQVKEIVGSDGEVMSEAGEKGSQFHTIIYTWKGEGSIGANANFTFQGGKLQAKAQVGLK